MTSASGVTMIGYWLVQIVGRSNANPYLGIIFFLLLPALFMGGLAAHSDRRLSPPQKAPEGRADSGRISQGRSERSHLSPRSGHCPGGHHRQLAGCFHRYLSRARRIWIRPSFAASPAT